MDKFWNYFPSEQKFNVFLGEEYCNYDQSPSRKELAAFLLDKIPEALRHRVHNKESLSEISQDLLDLAIFSRNNLIKTVEEFGKNISLNFSCYTPILENKRFQAIINMNMFLPLEREFHEKLHPIFPFSEPTEEQTNKLPFYRILGCINQSDKVFLTAQDTKKLKLLSFYQNFWTQLRKELMERPTILLGMDLENKDVQEILGFLLEEIHYEKQNIYLVTSSSILSTNVTNFINKYDIKLLMKDTDSFQKSLDEKVVDVQKQLVW